MAIKDLNQEDLDFLKEGLVDLVENEKRWNELLPLLIKEINKIRKGSVREKIETIVRLYNTEGIYLIRAVRDSLKLVVSCSCGQCDQRHTVPAKKHRGKIEFPIIKLCESDEGGRTAIPKKRVRNRGEH